MMRTIILLSLLALASIASAQVQRIGQTPQPADTTPQLSIMFNYQQSPSALLEQSGRHRQQAITSLIVCEAIGGVALAHAYEHMDAEIKPATLYLGIGFCAAGGILYLALDALSASETKRAGEQLRRITFSLGGVSYHF